MDNVCLTCGKCGKEIKYGEGYVSINRNIEQQEYIIPDTVEIQVIHSVDIISLCGACGNAFDVDALETIIRTIPRLNPNNWKHN